MPIPIEAVTFDAAGTLFFPKPSVGAIYQEVLAAHDVILDPVSLERAFHTAMKGMEKDASIADSEERERAYWETVVADSIRHLTSLPGNFDTIFEALWQEFAKGSRWTLSKDANDIFDYLDDRRIPFALLTNWDSRVRSVLGDHSLENRFSHVFISSEIGFEKPDPGLFDFAARSLRVQPNRILHVGDHLEQDVRGAHSAGWQAVHFNPENQANTENAASLSCLGDLRHLLSED